MMPMRPNLEIGRVVRRVRRDQDPPGEPGQDPVLVARRGHEAGDHQLPDLQAGARRAVLREDLRTDHRLGVPLRQVQAHEAPRRDLRQVRRRGHPVQGAPRAHGPHRAGLPGEPRLVLQGPALAHRPPARHRAARPRAHPLLRVLRGHRSGRLPRGEAPGAALRRALPPAAREVPEAALRDGRRGDQGAAAPRRRRDSERPRAARADAHRRPRSRRRSSSPSA